MGSEEGDDAVTNNNNSQQQNDHDASSPSPSTAPTTPPTDDDTQASLSSTVRRDVGYATVRLSDWINENLVTARYVGLTTIAALTAFGISQTPLFFRYHSVADIPARLFQKRRYLAGRLIMPSSSGTRSRATQATTAPQEPLRLYVRHLSPMERLLSKRLFDKWIHMHPGGAAAVNRELLPVEIAGVVATDYYTSATDPPGAWLDRLAQQHTVVTVQLLGRRIVSQQPQDASSDQTTSSARRTSLTFTPTPKRPIPGLEQPSSSVYDNDTTEQIAVARVYYRPKSISLSLGSWFATDLGLDLVRWGRADVSANGLYGVTDTKQDRLVDTTDVVKDIQADAAYMDRLAAAEYQAAAESRGQWADAKIRQARSDIVQEVDFQTTATIWQKLWRRFRGG